MICGVWRIAREDRDECEHDEHRGGESPNGRFPGGLLVGRVVLLGRRRWDVRVPCGHMSPELCAGSDRGTRPTARPTGEGRRPTPISAGVPSAERNRRNALSVTEHATSLVSAIGGPAEPDVEVCPQKDGRGGVVVGHGADGRGGPGWLASAIPLSRLPPHRLMRYRRQGAGGTRPDAYGVPVTALRRASRSASCVLLLRSSSRRNGPRPRVHPGRRPAHRTVPRRTHARPHDHRAARGWWAHAGGGAPAPRGAPG